MGFPDQDFYVIYNVISTDGRVPDPKVLYLILELNEIHMSELKKEDPRPSNRVVVITEDERERLLRDIYRPDIEKLYLFTQMLRTNNLLKKAKITHK